MTSLKLPEPRTTAAKFILQALLEAEHQGYDGWTDEETVIIEKFVADISLYAHMCADTYEKEKEIDDVDHF